MSKLLTLDDIRALAERLAKRIQGQKVLAIIPDNTRSGGEVVGAALKSIADVLAADGRSLTALVALGTHAPLKRHEILKYLGLSAKEAKGITFANHEWKQPSRLVPVHTLSREEMLELSEGKFDLDSVRLGNGVPVDINYRVTEATDVVILGPTLPHEVVGCSSGVKYYWPGVSGRRITGVTHWLGATITIPDIIGVKHTPVRATMDFLTRKLVARYGMKQHSLLFVPRGKEIHGAFIGDPWEAYDQAADLTLEVNVQWVNRKYDRIVGLGSPKYPELWTAGKVSYKLQNIVNPGGELLIVGKHIDHVSDSWGDQIEGIGYHCMPYIRAHLPEYLDRKISLGVLAHVTHVYGTGTYDGEQELPTINVKLAGGISPALCKKINLPHVDIRTLDIEALRRDPNTLVVEDAGEVLYRFRAKAEAA